jgi:2-oxoglutarate dehydrogenase E1 component
LEADFNPLGLDHAETHSELDPATYGLTIWDYDREFFVGPLKLADPKKKFATLREILEVLRVTYCGKIGAEYMHIQSPEEKHWLQERMEPNRNQAALSRDVRVRALERVVEAEEFEHFLHTRFIGHKRFSLEGAESAVAILDEVLDTAANNSVAEAVIGMAHRGRLNVLANIIGKSMVQVFSEFEGNVDPHSAQGSGDVKYHLGASGIRKSTEGREITVSVAFNPSHLEAVDPVVEGIVRPKQDRMGDTERARVIPILIHGDAAFAGQGVVAETLNMSQLEGYTTGGTIHLVINNQIGFTTNPFDSRSSAYSTDIARMVQAPIFHVNGDDPEACVRCARMAYEYRQQFKKDVVIDMVCYRRHGHNEADDPSYTQPIMYRKIREHASVAVQYGERLLKEKLVDPARVAEMRKAVSVRLNAIYDQSKKSSERFEVGRLTAVSKEAMEQPHASTAIDRPLLERIVHGITTFPAEFHLHPKLKGLIERRKEALQGAPLDWGMGETLAFGSLVLEGTPVRLSGQDSGRGTFSQRHLEYYDNETGKRYIPLQHLAADQARFEVVDSLLSEYAVMGFEFGFSVADPMTLVAWEAQFGDFANGAQIMIDQFIASAESKWNQPSGLVLLLPHGYEGQGPEHSSARIERFLQLCAENNLQVANATTPAQYFHLLRRQMNGGLDGNGMRKPLILFTPKRMLRHPKAVSTIQDLITGGFQEVLRDSGGLDANRVTRVAFCSGQIYYDLAAAREERKANHVALLRLEQIYPFPASELEEALAAYPDGAEVVWVQEEPKNMGAWRSVQEWMEPLLSPTRRAIRYIGRPESASPSAGSLKRHQQEQAEVVTTVFAAAVEAEPAGMHLVAR